MSSDPRNGDRVEGRVVPWCEPSAFEIAAMAKLKTMVPEKLYDAFVWERETMAIASYHGLDPEVNALYEQIREDRREVLEKAILEGRVGRRREKGQGLD